MNMVMTTKHGLEHVLQLDFFPPFNKHKSFQGWEEQEDFRILGNEAKRFMDAVKDATKT